MGTDIHAVFQKRVGHDWIDIPCEEWDQDRHYYLFAWLADVRNGFGFAGVPTHIPIKPISKPRGLPSDFQIEDDRHKSQYGKYVDEDGTCWLGDHSHSWLLCSEILTAKRPVTRKRGVITLEQYRQWNKVSTPESYSGSCYGKDFVVSIPTEISDKTTHVQVEWCEDGQELDYFVSAIKKLVDEYGTCRMVFGFDS